MNPAVVILAAFVVVLLGVIVVLWRAVNIALDECADIATELAHERTEHELTIKIIGEQAVIQYDLKTERDALLAKVEHLELTRDDACAEATKQRQRAIAALDAVGASIRVVDGLAEFFTAEQEAGTPLHHMHAEWSGGMWPRLRVVCTAPPEALCRADWDCQCESWDAHGIDDEGRAWHELTNWDLEESTSRHYGKPGGECTYELFINESDNADELGSGEVRFPVSFEWEGDYCTWSSEQVSA